jgi:acyl-CoA reductase-like NAD-dependent aldehyde dehydrogenase
MKKITLPTTPRQFDMYINGQRTAGQSGRTMVRNSPGHGVPVARWPDGVAADSQAAVQAARTAFDTGPWKKMSSAERATILAKVADLITHNAEELAEIECLETGKPVLQALGEIQGAADIWRFAAGAARTIHGDSFNNLGARLFAMVLRQPLGVVGLITPWNFPFFILAERLPFLLAAGCTTVIKPSEATSGSTLRLCDFLAEAGVPAGVVNVVTGYGQTVGQAILDSDGVDMVSFTGSTAVGRKVIAASAKTIKKVGLELGGKNPHIVFADANLDDAADGVAFGMAFNAGQCCVGGSRLLVERSVMQSFTQKLANKLQRIRVGDPLDESTQVGALFDEGHMQKVLGYIDSGLADGATLACGGSRTSNTQGYFIQPTLLTNVRPDMAIVKDEIFGPVMVVIPFDSYEEALQIANGTEYGLSASIWTQDLNTAMKAVREVEAGRIWVNTTLDNGPETPLGGMKQSGIGRDAGVSGIEEYTEVKTAHFNLQPRTHWIQ